MGYYTWFEFSTKDNKHSIADIVDYMKEMLEESDWFYPYKYDFKNYENDDSCDDFELSPGDVYKWYDYHDEMISLSTKFQGTVFCLYGKGEETEDMWYAYYKNGKSQYCQAKIVFDEYDETKLK